MLKELLKETMDAARSPFNINTLPFKECTPATLSVTKTDILLQRKEGCN